MHTWSADSLQQLITNSLDWLADHPSISLTLINLDPSDQRSTNPIVKLESRPTIAQESAKGRIKLVSLINSPQDPIRVLYSYLCFFQVSDNRATSILINGFLERLSIIYSQILSKVDASLSLAESDFCSYTLPQVISVISKLSEIESRGGCHVILNDSTSIVKRLDFIYLSTSLNPSEVIDDFSNFTRSHMVSLKDVLKGYGVEY